MQSPSSADRPSPSLSEPAEKTLATLFPESDRPAAVAALDGVLKRTGGALGNVLVLATVTLSLEPYLPLFALLPAGLWLIAAIPLGLAVDAFLIEPRWLRVRRYSLGDSRGVRIAFF